MPCILPGNVLMAMGLLSVLGYALVAQLAERILGKDEVGSSSLLGGSIGLIFIKR